MLIKNPTLLLGYVAVFVVALVGNLIIGKFNLGFADQPIAHTNVLWNFLGMALTGYGSVLIGGCPLRQTIMAGEGNADGAICVVGMVLGAAFAHNFGLAASPAGVPVNGQVAVIIGFVVLGTISVTGVLKKKGVVTA
jgi:YedE family putative selenium metabolism protein